MGNSGLRLAPGGRGGWNRHRVSRGATSHVHARCGGAVCQGGWRTSPSPSTMPADPSRCGLPLSDPLGHPRLGAWWQCVLSVLGREVRSFPGGGGLQLVSQTSAPAGGPSERVTTGMHSHVHTEDPRRPSRCPTASVVALLHVRALSKPWGAGRQHPCLRLSGVLVACFTESRGQCESPG